METLSFWSLTVAVRDAIAVQEARVIGLDVDHILAATSQGATLVRAVAPAITEVRAAHVTVWGLDPIRVDIGLHANAISKFKPRGCGVCSY